MSVIAAAVVGSVVVGGISASKQNKAAKEAANRQQEGIENAQQYNAEAAKESSAMLDPLAALTTPGIAKMGQTATRYEQLGNEGITAMKREQSPLNVAEFLDPSMKFQQAEGQKAIQASAAARGGLLSGAALKELTQYSQGLASTNYNTAVSQAQNNRNQQLGIADSLQNYGTNATNINQNLMNTGINATGQQANTIAMQGTNNANLAMTSGNVAGAAAASQKSVLGSALGAGLSTYMFSDEDLKVIDGAVTDEEIDDFLNNLEATEYDYTDEAKAKGAPSGRQVGIIAQDAEKSKMGRSLVKKDEDGDRMLDVPKTVSALLASTATLNKRLKKIEGKK